MTYSNQDEALTPAGKELYELEADKQLLLSGNVFGYSHGFKEAACIATKNNKNATPDTNASFLGDMEELKPEEIEADEAAKKPEQVELKALDDDAEPDEEKDRTVTAAEANRKYEGINLQTRAEARGVHRTVVNDSANKATQPAQSSTAKKNLDPSHNNNDEGFRLQSTMLHRRRLEQERLDRKREKSESHSYGAGAFTGTYS